MGEGRFHSESYGGNKSERLEVERIVKRSETQELIVTITEADLLESQTSFAKGHSAEKFEDLPPILRADFWKRENGVPDNYLKAEDAAKEAGLKPLAILDYKIDALEFRMNALSRSTNSADIKEFYSLDKIGQQLKQERDELVK